MVSTRYIAGYIYMAYEELGEEIERPSSYEALAYSSTRSAQRDDMKLEFMMPPGQLCFANNYTVLHARTGFEDESWIPRPAACCCGLWLTAHDRRPIDPEDRDLSKSGHQETREPREHPLFKGDATDVLEKGRAARY